MMRNRNYGVFFFLVSFLLYIVSPDYFSHTFVICELFLYIINCLAFFVYFTPLLKVYNFALIFCFSFFICNFFYPVFVHPYIPLGLIVHDFNESYICQGTALAQLGFSSFLLGEEYFLRNVHKESIEVKFKTYGKNDLFDTFSLILIWTYAILILLLSHLDYNLYNVITASSLTLLSFVQVFFIITMIYRSSRYRNVNVPFRKFILSEKFYLLGMMLAIIGLAIIGDRGPIIQFLLAIFTIYFYLIFRIPIKYLMFIFVIGILGMIIIRNNRIGGQYSSAMEYREQKYGMTVPVYIDVFSDLIGTARCMYLGLEFVDDEGYLNGSSFVKPIFSPIPFLPTIIAQLLYNSSPSELSTGKILTEETMRRENREDMEGIGTNNVVDLYMNSGVIGTCLFMWVFGYFVGFLECHKRNSIYCFFCYCVLMSLSIYIPRSTIFDCTRLMIWGVVIFWFRNSYPNRFKSYAHTVYK